MQEAAIAAERFAGQLYTDKGRRVAGLCEHLWTGITYDLLDLSAWLRLLRPDDGSGRLRQLG